jgi:hypothetical protein
MSRLLILLSLLVACSEPAEPSSSAAGASSSAATPSGASGASGAASAGQLGGAGASGGRAAPAGGSGGGGVAVGGGAQGGGAQGGGAQGGGAGSALGGAGGAAGGAALDPEQLPKITLHLAGDSTVMTYAADSAQEGWGQELPPYFNARLAFDNQAQGGASVETFYTGRWKTLLGGVHAGDFVMAAFGANDSGTVSGRHVEPADFQARFAVMASEVQAKQATFIIVTPSALQEWSNGKEGNVRLGPYVSVLHTLADSQQLPLVDLNARSLELLNQVGQEAAKEIYLDGDKAHFTKQGATQMAGLVAAELTRTGSPLAAYLRP